MPTTPVRSVTIFGGSTVDRIATSHAPPIMGASNPGGPATAPGVGFNLAAAAMAVESAETIPPNLTAAAIAIRLDADDRRAA